MNTKAFLIGVGVIIFAIGAYVFYRSQQPLEPEGSLTNIEISPTSIGDMGPTISSTPPGLP